MSLLDRYDEIQRRPLGTNTALSPGNDRGVGGSAGSQFRQQESAYGRALRILDRQARRGDANSALRAIATREQAMGQGYSPGGIRNKVEADAGISGRIGQMEQDTLRRRRAADLLNQQTDESMVPPEDPTTRQQDAIDPGFVKPSKIGAALDILEGDRQNPLAGGDRSQYNRGFSAAQALGVTNPDVILDGDQNLTYRRTLDQALGQARTPEEIDALRNRGTRYGVPVDAFNRRARWWETNRTQL